MTCLDNSCVTWIIYIWRGDSGIIKINGKFLVKNYFFFGTYHLANASLTNILHWNQIFIQFSVKLHTRKKKKKRRLGRGGGSFFFTVEDFSRRKRNSLYRLQIHSKYKTFSSENFSQIKKKKATNFFPMILWILDWRFH